MIESRATISIEVSSVGRAASLSWNDGAAAVGPRGRGQVEEGLVPVEEAVELVDHQGEEAQGAASRPAGEVGRQEDVVERLDRAVRRHGLGVEDVESGTDVAAPE